MVGPLLRYDTVDENGLWHGAALIVSTYLSRISQCRSAHAAL